MTRRVAGASAPGVSVALVDPDTLLGRDVKAVLSERRFPVGKLHLFHTRGAVEGLLTADDEEAAYVAPFEPDSLDVSTIAFFCGAPEPTGRALACRTDEGCLAIDLSGVSSGGPMVALRAGDPEALLPEGRLYLTPDPTAYVLAEAVRALDRLTPVESVTAAVDRPVSELGKAALDEMFQQAISIASFQPLPKEILETQGAFNIHQPADTAAWEEKVARDFRQVVGREIPLALLSARSGTFHGHYLRLLVRFASDAPPLDKVRRALFAPGSPWEDVDPENLSGPVECAGRDETLVLRLETSGREAKLALASDHLRRGGAQQAVMLAERALRERTSPS